MQRERLVRSQQPAGKCGVFGFLGILVRSVPRGIPLDAGHGEYL